MGAHEQLQIAELCFMVNGLATENGFKLQKNAFDASYIVRCPNGDAFLRDDIHAALTLILGFKDEQFFENEC